MIRLGSLHRGPPLPDRSRGEDIRRPVHRQLRGREGAVLDDMAGMIGRLRVSGDLLADEDFRRRIFHLVCPRDGRSIGGVTGIKRAGKCFAIE